MNISRHGKILVVLLTVSFLLKMVLIAQDIEVIIPKFMTDDSYYAYDIAYNVATGKGITFNDNVPTNGFHPLYNLLILPPLMKLFLPIGLNAPIYASLVVLSLFTSGTGIFLYLICFKILNKTAGLFAAFIWLFNPYVIFVSLMGLEVPVQIFILSVLVWFIINKNSYEFSLKESIIIGLLIGLTFLARMDAVFIGIGTIIILLIRKFLNKPSLIHLLKQKDLYVIVLTALLVASPWLIWSIDKVGRITPHSGEAGDVIDYIRYITPGVFSYNDLRINVVHSFFGFITKFFFYIIDSRLLGAFIILSALILPLTILFLKRDKIYGILLKLDFLILSAALYYMYYVFRATGLRDWYSLFTSFVISILFAIVSVRLSERFVKPNILLSSIIALLVISFVYGGIIHYERGNCPLCLGTYEMAIYATANIPSTEVIGAYGAGILQYYTPNHDVINLDGVVNPKALEALKNDKLDSFALENNITYVIETPISWFYTTLFNKPTIKYEESEEEFITRYWSYKKEDSGIFVYKIFKIQPA